MKYLNRDTNQIQGTHYYTGKTRENVINFKFDYEVPVHCIGDSTPCLDKSPLRLDEDITRVLKYIKKKKTFTYFKVKSIT